MTLKAENFQCGKILHEVIAGVFRSNGTTLAEWCKQNDLNFSSVTNVTHGRSNGPRGRSILNRLIDAAGYDAVALSYRKRIEAEAASFAKADKGAAA